MTHVESVDIKYPRGQHQLWSYKRNLNKPLLHICITTPDSQSTSVRDVNIGHALIPYLWINTELALTPVPLIKMHYRVRYSLDFDLKIRSGQVWDQLFALITTPWADLWYAALWRIDTQNFDFEHFFIFMGVSIFQSLEIQPLKRSLGWSKFVPVLSNW